jgi:hypothetical protein
MSYGSRNSSSSPRRSSGRGRGKVHRKRGKRKGQKHRFEEKYSLKTSETHTSKEVVEKTLSRLNNLAQQTLAFFPFSQYFDDWLLSLKSVIFEFESNPNIGVDEAFVKKRSKIIAEVELRLSKRRSEETAFEETARKLAEYETILVQIDAEYSYAIQKLKSEKKKGIKLLKRRVQDLETDLEETNQTKVSILSPIARRAKSHKKAELETKLNVARMDLESEVKALEVEQEKLRINYDKKKQRIIDQVRNLKKKVSGLQPDSSAKDRQATCELLINAIKEFLQKKKSTH